MIKAGSCYATLFETWGDYVDFAESRTHSWPDAPGFNSSRQRDSGFTGTPSFEAAIKLARRGWEDGANDIKKVSHAMFTRISSLVRRRQCVTDVVGSSVIVGRYLAGAPDCMQRFQYTTVTGGAGRKILRLVFNCGASGFIGTDVMIRKGSAIVALVEALEYMSHSVEVFVGEGIAPGYGGGQPITAETTIRVKPAGGPVDLPRLAFAMAHPSMLRRLMFAVNESFPREWCEALHLPGSYGVPCDYRPEMQGDIYIPKSHGYEPQWATADTAEAWVMDQLAARGVSLIK